jgi:hypothetical protein
MEDRQRWRQESLARLGLIQPGDLVKMVGMLAHALSERRRESELDVLRTERFHAENAEMLEHHRRQAADYARRLEIASGVIRMLTSFEGGEDLRSALVSWASRLPLWREPGR